jgi:hypothetical protein
VVSTAVGVSQSFGDLVALTGEGVAVPHAATGRPRAIWTLRRRRAGRRWRAG